MPVLKTRLYKPIVKTQFVTRYKILDYLDRHSENSLTLVVAAAGYGKSVTVSQWLDRRKPKYAWISLDSDCNDLRTFLDYVVTCIQISYPDSLSNIHELCNVMDLPSVRVISNMFVNEITKLDEEFVLVLDDYHLLSNQEIHAMLNEILRYPSEKLKIFILSRRDPPLKLSSLKAYERINEVRMSELRFDENEVIGLSDKLNSHPIDHDTASELVKATEGWIIGIRLAIQSISQGRDLNVVISGLGNEKQVVTQFLWDEIIHPQSRYTRDCLLKASILSRFCEDILAEVCADEDVQDKSESESHLGLIREITSKTLFIIPLDSERIWFRFHHLFHEILQKQLEKRYNSDQISALHWKASRWFERNGHFDEAIRHAVGAGDLAFANDIIDEHFRELFDYEQLGKMDRWLKMLPVDSWENYLAPNLISAFICDLQQDMIAMEKDLNKAHKILVSLSPDDPQNELKWGYYYALESLLLYKTGRIGNCLESSTYALERLATEHSLLKNTALLYHSFALIADGKYAEADEKVIHYRASVPSGDPLELARNSVVHSYVSFLSGNLPGIYRSLSPVIDYYKGKSYNITRGMAYYYLGFVNYEWNHLDEAIRWFDIIWGQRYSSMPRWILHHLYIKILALRAKGEKAAMTALLDDAHQYVDDLGLPFGDQFLACLEVEIALGENDPDRVERFQYKADYHRYPPYCFYYVPQFTSVKLKLSEGGAENYRNAGTELREVVDYLRKTHNQNLLIQALALQAVLFKLRGDIEGALEGLSEAINLAKPGGFIRVFVDLGEEIRNLMVLHRETNADDPYIEKILNAFSQDRSSMIHQSNHGKINRQSIAPVNRDDLSPKEIEIINLLSQGFQYKEIAGKMFHSPGTIKNYVSHIYQKLGTKNRTNAISVARELGLLPSK